MPWQHGTQQHFTSSSTHCQICWFQCWCWHWLWQWWWSGQRQSYATCCRDCPIVILCSLSKWHHCLCWVSRLQHHRSSALWPQAISRCSFHHQQLNVSLGVDYMYYRAGARKHLMQVWIMSTHSQVSNFISNHSTMKKWHCQNQMERQTSILDQKSLLANLEGRKPPIQKASISVK